MYPLQNWLYGIGLSLRFNLFFSLITVFGYIFMKNKPPFKVTGLFVLVVIFCIHSYFGVALYAIYDGMWDQLWVFVKTIIFFIFSVLLLRKREHFEAILFFLVLALCFFGLMEGIKVILSGGGHIIVGMQGSLGDNNKVALGLNMTIPLILYLMGESNNKNLKLILIGTAFLCVMAIIGTNSRGGFIGLLFMGGYFWWVNGKKISIIFGASIILVVVLSVMPNSWFQRMDTIESADKVSTLTSRVTFWKINLLAAIDHPFVGLGFNATASKLVWQDYAHNLDSINFIIETPIPKKGFVAHSIYFEVLGNQGFVGLLLFLGILFLTIMRINNLKSKHYEKGSWQVNLLNAIKISILTFCVGGAALSAAYFELLYFLISIVICLHINALTKNNSPQILKKTANQRNSITVGN